ncbi:hypothetical protein LMG7974_01592 [Campylobacter majalis]|uniref:Plasmid replication protein RepL domain-containing protein n=1 Tax=Campylobacter majalis TaxID=2790656 RepID=A0ABN7KBH9_9BACT|nr:hypothetical protein [Campylobacter majalis]CAD7289515.1 hypothetical protein LMG7974_01592 [Campylobacter majalis]
MQNGIKTLESKRKKTIKLYDHTQEIINNETGEVTRTINSFTKEANTKDEFVKLYLENINFLQSLTNAELKILLYAIKRIDYTNSFSFSSNFIGYFTENKILSKSAVYKNFKSLTEKNVFAEATKEAKKELELYGNDIYFINPDIVSKGSFLQLKELKRTIVQTFDFQNLTMKQELITENKYDEFDNIKNNSKDYEIKKIVHSKQDRETETEFIIGKKEGNIIDIQVEEEPNLFNSINEEEPKKNILISNKKNNSKIENLKLEVQKSEIELEKANLNKMKDKISQLEFDFLLAEIKMKEAKINLNLELLKNEETYNE